jgi:hypothetical protein
MFNTFKVVAGSRECLIVIWAALILPALVKMIVNYKNFACEAYIYSVFTEGKNQTISCNYFKTHETICNCVDEPIIKKA